MPFEFLIILSLLVNKPSRDVNIVKKDKPTLLCHCEQLSLHTY